MSDDRAGCAADYGANDCTTRCRSGLISNHSTNCGAGTCADHGAALFLAHAGARRCSDRARSNQQ
jgi:hypothetical protein